VAAGDLKQLCRDDALRILNPEEYTSAKGYTSATEDHGRESGTTEDHWRPRETTGDHGRARETTGDHGRPRETTAKPQTDSGPGGVRVSHGRPRESTGDDGRPRETTRDHGRPLETMGDHWRPRPKLRILDPEEYTLALEKI